MNLVEIRVVIYLLDSDMAKLSFAIDRIMEVVKDVFPKFKIAKMNSPIKITIERIQGDGSEAIEPEDYP